MDASLQPSKRTRIHNRLSFYPNLILRLFLHIILGFVDLRKWTFLLTPLLLYKFRPVPGRHMDVRLQKTLLYPSWYR